jgi:hypothetical protein
MNAVLIGNFQLEKDLNDTPFGNGLIWSKGGVNATPKTLGYS